MFRTPPATPEPGPVRRETPAGEYPGRSPDAAPTRRRAAVRSRRRYAALRRRHDRLLRQLSMADQVQRGMLPRTLPQVPGVRLAAAYRPSQHMAGDFYSAFRLDRDRIGIYVGDAMGHGPAAALLGVYTMLTLRTKSIDGNRYEIIDPGAALAQLNEDLLRAGFPDAPFVTLAYGVLDLTGPSWSYCCAGHPHPLILRAGRPAEWLEPTAPLLGVLDAPFAQGTVALEPGDRLVLYSDGALAATWDGHGTGSDGLASALAPRDGLDLPQQLDSSLDGLHFADRAHRDDITVLALELLKQ